MIYPALRFFLYAIGLLLLFVIGALGFLQTGAGKRLLTGELSRQLSTDDLTIDANGLEGFVPFNMRLNRLHLSDRDGVWLSADKVLLDWSPSALLGGRLHVTALSMDRIEILRRPISDAPPKPTSDSPFRLPDLPGSLPPVIVDRLTVPEIMLRAPLFGETAVLALEGSIQTNKLGDEVIAALTLKRTDEATASVTLATTAGLARQTLDLSLDVTESGGLIGTLAGRSDIGHLKLSLDGSGPLSNWSGRLDADVAGLGTTGTVLGLALTDQPHLAIDGSIMPAPAALPNDLSALVGQQLSIKADVVQTKAQTLEFRELALDTETLTLAAEGSVNLDQGMLSFDGRIEAEDLEPLGKIAGLALAGTGSTDIRLGGKLDAPRGELDLKLTEASFDDKSASSIKTTLAWTTLFPLTSDRPAFDIKVDGKAKDLSIPGTMLPDSEIGWRAKLILPLDGKIKIDEATIETAGVELQAQGVIDPNTAEGTIDLNLNAPSLRRLTNPYGRAIEGTGQIRATIGLTDKAKDIAIDLDAKLAKLAGLPDGASDLIGDELGLKAKVRLDPVQTLSVADLVINGDHIQATGRAELALDNGSLQGDLEAALPDLAVFERLVPDGIEGAVDLVLDVRGALEAPIADLRLTTQGLVVGGEPIARLDVALAGADLIAAPNGNLEIDLTARETPTAVALAFRRTNGWFHIDDIDLSAPETTIAGNLAIDLDASLVEGALQGQSGDLGALAPWLQQSLSGSVKIDAKLSTDGDQQNATLAANANDLSGDFGAIDSVSITAQMSDLITQPQIEAKAGINGFEQGTTRLDRVTLDASGNEGALDFQLALDGEVIEPLSLTAKGATRITDGFVLGVESLIGKFADEPLRLAAPLAVQQTEDSIWLSDLDLRLGQATLQGDVEIHDGNVQGKIDLASLPLRWSEIFGGPEMSGVVNAAVDLSSDISNPRVSAKLDIVGQLSNAAPSEVPVDIELTALLNQGQLAAELNGQGLTEQPIYADARFPIRLSLMPFSLELPADGALEGRIDTNLQLARLAELLQLDDHNLSGNLIADATISGTLGEPIIRGPVSLEGGSYENGNTGASIQNLAIDALMASQRINLEGLTGSTGRQGLITSTGWIELTPENSFPLSVTLKLDQALLLDRDDAEARISGDIVMAGNFEEAEINGDLKVERAVIFLPDGGGPNLPEIEVAERNGRFVNPPATDTEKEAAQPFDPALSLNIALPNKIYVRGRGLESEWQGSLAISGRSSDPIITGSINIKKGYFDFLEKRFELTLGEIAFSGSSPPNPIIALEAVAEDDDFKAIIKLNGPADDPQFVLSSEPVLPDDEVLARLLFNRPLTEIGPIEAGKLALAVNKLRSSGGGFDAFGEIRNILQIDTLDVVSDQDGESRVRAGKYLNDDVYVEVERGAADETGRARVEIELLPNLSLEADTSEDANSGVGFKWKFDY